MAYTPGDNYSISLSGEDDGELRGYWEKLRRRHGDHAAGARAVGRHLRDVRDRYGVRWLVNIAGGGS